MTTVKNTIKLNSKPDLQVLRNALKEALSLVEDEYGIQISTGHCTYEGDGSGCTMKLDIRAIAEDGTVKTKEMKDLERYEHLLIQTEGLPEDWREKTFPSRDGQYKLVGYCPKKRKYPYLAENVKTGKQLLFTSAINRLMK